MWLPMQIAARRTQSYTMAGLRAMSPELKYWVISCFEILLLWGMRASWHLYCYKFLAQNGSSFCNRYRWISKAYACEMAAEKVVSKVKSHLGSLYEEESCHGQKVHSAKGIKLTAKTVDEDPASYIRWMGWPFNPFARANNARPFPYCLKQRWRMLCFSLALTERPKVFIGRKVGSPEMLTQKSWPG